jgi:hypothetical protein
MYPPYSGPEDPDVRPAAGVDVLRDTLRVDGDRAGLRVDFPHAEHQERLGGESGCQSCHHLAVPEDETTPCFQCHRRMVRTTLIFDHEEHWRAVAESEELGGLYPENHSCIVCHDSEGAKSAATAAPCLECHDEDPGWLEGVEGDAVTPDFARATSYLDAMHERCVVCHEQEAEEQGRAELSECSTCHRSLAPSLPSARRILEPPVAVTMRSTRRK